MESAESRPPVGVVFDSDMGNGIDDALALALLYGLDGRNETRVIGLSISRPSLQAARFCEAVERFYASGLTGSLVQYLEALPIGLVDRGPSPSDAPMLAAPLARKKPDGSPQYVHSIRSLKDTADPAPLIRNALTAQDDGNAIVVCTGPLTNLASLLALHGAKDLIARKVRLLAFAGGSFPEGKPEFNVVSDIAAARKVFAEWPTPVVVSGDEIGSAVLFPAASIEKDFAWSQAHPIADAYRASKPMPYDAPTSAMAPVLYAIRPNAGYFRTSEPGAITISDDGRTRFSAASAGKHQYLILDREQKERVLRAYVELASAKPVQRVLNLPDEKDEKKAPEKKNEKQPDAKP